VTARADHTPSPDLRAGLIAGSAAVLLLVAILLIDLRAVSFAFGGLVALAADVPGTRRRRMGGIGAWLVGGASVTAIGPAVSLSGWAMALLVLVVVGASSLAAASDTRFGLSALLVGLLAILQPALADPGGVPAFLLGGIAAGAVNLLRPRPDETGPVRDDGGAWFALVRGVVVATAMLVGMTLFEDHPSWTALTALIVLAPGAAETIAAAGARLMGTVIGAVVGLALVGLIAGQPGLAVVVVLAVAAQFTFRPYGYPTVVAFITVAVVAGTALVGGSTLSATADRVLATAVGAGIALVPLAGARLRSAG
jgi:hypothetical protein